MTKTQRKDALRNIWKQKVSYLSILVIAMLAVMAYLGINFASHAIANNGNAFYDETRFRDIEIISTKLLTADDMAAIRATPGVADVESVWNTSGKLLFGDSKASVNIVSLTQRINVPMLLEGRLPETADECALEQTIVEKLGIAIGETVSLQNPKGETAEFLGRSDFTVTGIVFHPDHGCLTLMVPGSREVVVRPEAFDLGAELQGCCMKAELQLDGTAGLDRFGKEYLATVQTVKEALDALSDERAALRDTEIRGRYQERIDEGQEELDNAAAALYDARRLLDENTALLGEKQTELDAAGQTLAEKQQELEDGRIRLEEAKELLDQTQRQLAYAQGQLAQGKAKLDDTAQQLADADAQLTEAQQQLEEGKAELDAGEAELAEAKKQLEAGEAELADAARQIEEGEQQLADAQQELDAGEAALDAGAAELNAGAATLTTTWLEIEDRKQDVRDTIHEGLKAAITNAGHALTPAEEAAIDAIPWAAKGGAPNLNDGTLDATWFQMTDGIGFQLSTINYAATAATAVAQFDALFDLMLARMQASGIDTAALAADKEAARAQLNTYLVSALALEAQYNESVAQLEAWNDGHDAYIAGAAALSAGGAEYSAGLSKYRKGEQELNDAKEQYAEGLAQYEEGKALYEEKTAEFEEGKARYEAGLAEYEEGKAAYEAGVAAYEDGLAQYEASLAKYEQGRKLYQQGLADYQSGLAQYEDGLAQYEDGVQQYEDGKRQLANGRTELAEKEAEYDEGFAQYEEGSAQLKSARAEMESQDPTRWVALDAQGNASYLTISRGSKNVADMGATFALVFVLVGALVIYATVGRIVDEQRRQVGATKALGLFNREILLKYLCFGVTAAVIGVIAGTAIGYVGIQRILTMVYGRYYVFGIKKLAFLPGLSALALLLGIALTGITVWLSCSELLRCTAIRLMQEKAPPSKFRAKAKRALPLYWRAVLLNMRTDKKRVAVTIVSVAGCCTLLVAGFSMRSSVMSALDRQFIETTVYDAKITWEPEANPDAGEEIAQALRDAGADWVALCDKDLTWSVDGALNSAEMLCAPLQELDSFFVRRDVKTGAPLDGADGVWISNGFSKTMGFGTGDTVTLYDDVMNPYPARVAGVYNEYAGREMVLSSAYYTAVFGAAPENNAFLLHWGSADPSLLRTRVAAIPGVDAFEEVAQRRETYQSYASVLNLIAGVLTLIAALMAYFILLNLASMYVNQKKRELTIMRVNGFTVKEVIRYVAGESIATTAIGIVLGLVLGTLLTNRILSLLEGDTLQLIHSVQWSGWLFGALITVVFSVVIYAVALRKVKYLKLTDVA